MISPIEMAVRAAVEKDVQPLDRLSASPTVLFGHLPGRRNAFDIGHFRLERDPGLPWSSRRLVTTDTRRRRGVSEGRRNFGRWIGVRYARDPLGTVMEMFERSRH